MDAGKDAGKDAGGRDDFLPIRAALVTVTRHESLWPIKHQQSQTLAGRRLNIV
jgi:hypothetical protein